MNDLVLITGGAGFIGLHLSRELVKIGYRVRIFDNFSPQVHAKAELPSDLLNNVELVSVL
jgi:dTDP-L-rhamnose 4-epimerase